MKRREAIQIISQGLNEKIPVISSLGLISRELFDLRDSPQNFYMTGSMGLASSIGLGVAINKPDLKVVVIDGDASLLMNLGSSVTIGHFKPKNLIHIVLDNEAYESCSGEPSISKTAKLDKIARTVGYNFVKKVKNKSDLRKALEESLDQNRGPIFILAKIELGDRRDLPRILKLDKIAKRFKRFLSRFN
jgi:thiamine pyrophosphate-dependent acetolactate synthase large subunit-like protein